MQRIILFGSGRHLEWRIEQLLNCSDIEILYILDNDKTKDNSSFHGIPIPEKHAYTLSLLEEIKGYPVVHIEKITHEEMRQLYKKIDAVVCPSRQDSLPIVVAEAFMNHKIAIMSDSVGTSHYVENEKQAFIFPTGDDKSLSDILRYVIQNFEALDEMREAGRKIYDEVFSMNAFEKRIQEFIVSHE